jgi:hypothetical protein
MIAGLWFMRVEIRDRTICVPKDMIVDNSKHRAVGTARDDPP